MRLLTLLILFAAGIHAAWGQETKFTLSGHVSDAGSGEELIGANIFEPVSGAGAVTNLYGFYSLTLPAGRYRIEFSYIGYSSRILDVNLTENRTLNVEIGEAPISVDEVVVTAEREDRNVESVAMSKEKLSIEKIKTIPVVFGEVDLIKAIQLLPGVQTVGEGQSGFFVRGGGSDQNILLLDGSGRVGLVNRSAEETLRRSGAPLRGTLDCSNGSRDLITCF